MSFEIKISIREELRGNEKEIYFPHSSHPQVIRRFYKWKWKRKNKEKENIKIDFEVPKNNHALKIHDFFMESVPFFRLACRLDNFPLDLLLVAISVSSSLLISTISICTTSKVKELPKAGINNPWLLASISNPSLGIQHSFPSSFCVLCLFPAMVVSVNLLPIPIELHFVTQIKLGEIFINPHHINPFGFHKKEFISSLIMKAVIDINSLNLTVIYLVHLVFSAGKHPSEVMSIFRHQDIGKSQQFLDPCEKLPPPSKQKRTSTSSTWVTINCTVTCHKAVRPITCLVRVSGIQYISSQTHKCYLRISHKKTGKYDSIIKFSPNFSTIIHTVHIRTERYHVSYAGYKVKSKSCIRKRKSNFQRIIFFCLSSITGLMDPFILKPTIITPQFLASTTSPVLISNSETGSQISSHDPNSDSTQPQEKNSKGTWFCANNNPTKKTTSHPLANEELQKKRTMYAFSSYRKRAKSNSVPSSSLNFIWKISLENDPQSNIPMLNEGTFQPTQKNKIQKQYARQKRNNQENLQAKNPIEENKDLMASDGVLSVNKEDKEKVQPLDEKQATAELRGKKKLTV